MTESPLKSVCALDSDTQTYKPVAHNMSAAQAVEQTGTHRTAKIVDQEKRHRNPDPTKCKACKKVAEELTTKHTESAGSEAGEQPVAAQESESD
jgi:hypothetical protein